MPTPAERQLVNPIRGDLVPHVEIGHAAQLTWGPGINDLVAESTCVCLELIYAFSVGSDINGL